ncbi:hypothetical protein BS47DRAFT_1369949 [Hydnum rufescens UP504]|uniref:Uncharacterized protein n=1 Tax=Hydnum rufescens UP504 TaxID=1448309 RepID=A0A9P6AB33_9AGAM|nr:hypothetical protein BS47DRAFT_1369949 [Hydnum rufescens UP504]
MNSRNLCLLAGNEAHIKNKCLTLRAHASIDMKEVMTLHKKRVEESHTRSDHIRDGTNLKLKEISMTTAYTPLPGINPMGKVLGLLRIIVEKEEHCLVPLLYVHCHAHLLSRPRSCNGLECTSDYPGVIAQYTRVLTKILKTTGDHSSCNGYGDLEEPRPSPPQCTKSINLFKPLSKHEEIGITKAYSPLLGEPSIDHTDLLLSIHSQSSELVATIPGEVVPSKGALHTTLDKEETCTSYEMATRLNLSAMGSTHRRDKTLNASWRPRSRYQTKQTMRRLLEPASA